MKQGQKSIRNKIQDILFPMEYMNITQGNNGQYSHQGVYALDLAGRNAGQDLVFAPFDVICMARDSAQNGNAAFWQSTQRVRFANGSIDYATIMLIHDNTINGIYKGARYAQGTQIAQEGTAGNAIGNHIHFEIAQGKFSHMYDKNKYGTYHLPNAMSADQCCFIDETIMVNDNAMNWKKLSDNPIQQTPSNPVSTNKEAIDQILHINSHVKFTTNKMTVTNYDKPTDCVFLKEIDAWAYPKYVTKHGASNGSREILYLKDTCYFTNNYFTVTNYDKATKDVYLKEAQMWAHPKDLTEVA